MDLVLLLMILSFFQEPDKGLRHCQEPLSTSPDKAWGWGEKEQGDGKGDHPNGP